MRPDIKQTARATRAYNFHSHTPYCDGRSPIDEMARAAAAAGFKHYAFTSHSPVSLGTPCNMPYAAVTEYISECERLKREYAGRMNLYTGMEIDYLSPQEGPHCEYFKSLPLDVRLGSVHFVPTQRGEYVDCDGRFERFASYLHDCFRDDLRYVVEKYFGQVAEMVALGGIDIIGHFDKIANNASQARPGIEDETWYQVAAGSVIGEIIASGLPVELNTKAYARRGRFFPDRRWWKRLADAGVTLVVNSDAHSADLIDAGRAEAFRALAEDGIAL